MPAFAGMTYLVAGSICRLALATLGQIVEGLNEIVGDWVSKRGASRVFHGVCHHGFFVIAKTLAQAYSDHVQHMVI